MKVRLICLLLLASFLFCLSPENSLASPQKLNGFAIDIIREEQNIFIQVNTEGELLWLLISESSEQKISSGDLHEFTQCEVRKNVQSASLEKIFSEILSCSGVTHIPMWASVAIPEGLILDKLYMDDPSHTPVTIDHTIQCRFVYKLESNGSTPKYYADIAILRNGSEVAAKMLGGGVPLVFEGFTYYFVNSETLADQYMATIRLDAKGVEKVFPIIPLKESTWPEEGLTFGIVKSRAAEGETSKQHKIWFNDGKDGPVEFWIGEEETKLVEQSGKTYSFAIRPRYHAGIAAYKTGNAEKAPKETKGLERDGFQRLADQYWRKAQELIKQNKFLEAAKMLEKSAEAEKSSPKPRMADLVTELNNAGYFYKNVGQYDKALEHYQQALEIGRKLGSEADVAIPLSNIGGIHQAQGQYNRAIGLFQQALEIARKLGQEDSVAIRFNNIGGVYDSWGKYDKAIEYYLQALEINKRLGKEDHIATNLNNIGSVYKSWGQYDKAMMHYQKALEIDRKLGEEVGVAIDLHNIGSIYDSWGKYDEAIEYYRQALEINKRLGKIDHIAIQLNNLGAVYCSLGQYGNAIEYFDKALEINRKLRKENQIAAQLNNIGMVYKFWGQYDKAIEHYLQVLEIDRKLGRKADIAGSLNNIGGVYKSWGQYDNAIKHFEQALEINRRLSEDAEIAKNLNNMGVIYDSWGQYDKAIEHYRDSITILEKLRKTATGDVRRDYLASQIFTYQALASAYLKNNDPDGVLQSVEQSRAKLLAERIAGIDSELSLPTLDVVQKGLANDEAVLIFSNIDQDNFILMVITGSAISIKEISKDSYLAQAKKLYMKQILLMLDKQQGRGAARGMKEGQLSAKAVNTPAFETSINYYRKLLVRTANGRKGRLDHSNKFASLLYKLLIQPAEDALKNKKKLIIVPDGILGFLPFETLVTEDNKYLAEAYDIKYSQSLTISSLLNKRQYKENRKPVLAFGGAVYDEPGYTAKAPQNSAQLAYVAKESYASVDQNRSLRSSYEMLDRATWSNLPGTLSEVQNISTIVTGTDVITGDAVTENKVKSFSTSGTLAEYKVLHFATHGLVVPELPELSAIVLSQFVTEKDGEDGYLRMGEIAELDIKADFVNLSACETGLGRIYGGEGVVGLTQSFLIAGANGLSVSLWQVADDSTSKFMSEVYKKVEETGVGYSQAIAAIKRGFINGEYGEKWKSPFYWSPFVYYGK